MTNLTFTGIEVSLREERRRVRRKGQQNLDSLRVRFRQPPREIRQERRFEACDDVGSKHAIGARYAMIAHPCRNLEA